MKASYILDSELKPRTMKSRDLIKNPYELIFNRFDSIEEKLLQIEKELFNKPEPLYTIKEAAKLLRMHPNTVRRHIDKETIDADTSRYPIVIPHSSIFDENDNIKSLKYKH